MCNWIDVTAARPGHDMQVLLWAPETEEIVMAWYDARLDLWVFDDAPAESASNKYFIKWAFIAAPKEK